MPFSIPTSIPNHTPLDLVICRHSKTHMSLIGKNSGIKNQNRLLRLQAALLALVLRENGVSMAARFHITKGVELLVGPGEVEIMETVHITKEITTDVLTALMVKMVHMVLIIEDHRLIGITHRTHTVLDNSTISREHMGLRNHMMMAIRVVLRRITASRPDPRSQRKIIATVH